MQRDIAALCPIAEANLKVLHNVLRIGGRNVAQVFLFEVFLFEALLDLLKLEAERTRDPLAMFVEKIPFERLAVILWVDFQSRMD